MIRSSGGSTNKSGDVVMYESWGVQIRIQYCRKMVLIIFNYRSKFDSHEHSSLRSVMDYLSFITQHT